MERGEGGEWMSDGGRRSRIVCRSEVSGVGASGAVGAWALGLEVWGISRNGRKGTNRGASQLEG